MNTADWSLPTRIRVGPGRVDELALACAEAGIRRPLVVTDRGLVASTPLRAVLDALAGTTHALYGDVHPDPTDADVAAGVARYHEHRADGIVAVGGGSALDVGKLIAFMSGQHRPIWDFIDEAERWRLADPTGIAPVVAVPTTAGTGSEVGRAAVVTANATKYIVFHPAMLPASVIADAELTVGMPAWLTAGTGMDALCHALEAWCSPVWHPMADGIAAEAVGLVLRHLPAAIADPGDLDARQGMLVAALMGAVAFQKGLGAMHALAHPIGAVHHTHHGTTTAVLLPYVLAANGPAITARLDQLAVRLGTEATLTDRFLELRDGIGIPDTLEALGVTDPDIDALADAATRDPSAATNPVAVTAEYAAAVLDAAMTASPSDLRVTR